MMKYRQLGKTNMQVSAIAFGCWAIAGGKTWGPQDRADSIAAIKAAYDSGINFFDTAEAYGDGESERLLAQALKDKRDQVFIASKAFPFNFAKDKLIQACDNSLKNLQSDYIDLYQLHWPNSDIPLTQTLDALAELQAAGKIRAYGVSNYGPQQLQPALTPKYAVQSNQLAYNLLFRAIEDEIIPLCQQNQISVLCYSPLMQGLLTGKYTAQSFPQNRARTRLYSPERPNTKHEEGGAEGEAFTAVEKIKQVAHELDCSVAQLSLAWLMAQPGVTSVIAGGRNEQQATSNAAAANLQLDSAVIEKLAAITEPVKTKLGSNADMWKTASRIK